MEGNLYEIVNEALRNENPQGIRYSDSWAKIWYGGLYHFNEVIAESVGCAIVSTPDGRINPSVEATDDVIEIVHAKIRSVGAKETLAFAKQLMNDAYTTQTPVYELLRRV